MVGPGDPAVLDRVNVDGHDLKALAAGRNAEERLYRGARRDAAYDVAVAVLPSCGSVKLGAAAGSPRGPDPPVRAAS